MLRTTPASGTAAGSPAPTSAPIRTAIGGSSDALLARDTGHRRRLIVSDGLFSMDGDLAPLAELADIARCRGAMLLVDEAHATGVFGENGRGTAEHLHAENGITARIGTLSKALGCSGGFISGSRDLIDYVINRGRSYIYSTAAPAAIAAAAAAAVEIVAAEPHRRRELLRGPRRCGSSWRRWAGR